MSEINLELVTPETPGLTPYLLQTEPPHRLASLADIPIGYLSGEASFLRGIADGVLANMRQLGMNVEDRCL